MRVVDCEQPPRDLQDRNLIGQCRSERINRRRVDQWNGSAQRALERLALRPSVAEAAECVNSRSSLAAVTLAPRLDTRVSPASGTAAASRDDERRPTAHARDSVEVRQRGALHDDMRRSARMLNDGWQGTQTLRLALEQLTTRQVPGIAAAIVGPGGIKQISCAGVADLSSDRSAMPETVYLWFSMTKIVTATVPLTAPRRDRRLRVRRTASRPLRDLPERYEADDPPAARLPLALRAG